MDRKGEARKLRNKYDQMKREYEEMRSQMKKQQEKMKRHLGMVRAAEGFLLDKGKGAKNKAAGKERKKSDRPSGK